MPVDLYYVHASPPCRAVLLGAKAVGVTLNLKVTDLQGGEHLKPEFLKMNPQHTIPTINDNGFALGESRAILGYLADQYAKNDSLNPKDPKKRAKVNQRLDFDLGTLYQSFKDYYFPQMFGVAAADPEKFKKLEDAHGMLDKFLDGQDWVAGSNMTIADIAIVATVATAVEFGVSLNKFPNVVRWFEKCKKTIPSYEELSRDSLEALKKYFDSATKKK